jgi:hypothetical protein
VKLLNTLSDLGKTLKDKIQSIFQKEDLRRIAYSTKFIQRSTSLLQPDDFLQLLTSASIEPAIVPLEGLCEKLRTINSKVDIAPQSLMERINRKEASDYLEQILNKSLCEGIKLIVDKVPADLLKAFNNVYLEDATQCVLNEALSRSFKGTGGNASKSIVKINFIYEVHRRVIQDIKITDRRTPDQEMAKRVLELVEKDDLIIRDLGYFSKDVFKKIIEAEAYFLSRLSACVCVYLRKDDEVPLDLSRHFDKYFENESMIDLQVYITAEKIPVRLVAYRAPPEVAEKRRRAANRNAQKRGRMLSAASRNRLDFSLFITNVSQVIWKAEVVGTIYTLRWQVELIFKEWKSSLKIHYIKGTCEHRVRCLLFGKLITIVIINMIFGVVDWYAEALLKQQVSLHKLVNWLLRESRLAKILLTNLSIEIDLLINEIWREKRGCLLKQKRKRKTTLGHIKSATPYWELYQKFEDEELSVC